MTAIDYTRPASDGDYWGDVVASLVEDPRNIQYDEWPALHPVYDHLLDAADGAEDLWEGARAVAIRIASERGLITSGPGECKSSQSRGLASFDRVFRGGQP
jgi:hypothetical protein